MGHTATSQRIAIDLLLSELQSFKKALRKEEQPLFEDMLSETMKHVGVISYTSSLNVWAVVLLAILFEQHKKIHQMEEEYVADRCV